MNGPDLRRGLLGAEPPSDELQRAYRERLRGLLERRMTAAEKAVHAGSFLIALGMTVQFVRLFLQQRADARPVTLVALAVGLAFSAGWSVFSVVLLRRRSEDVRWHGYLRTQLVGLFTFALAGLMLWAGLEVRDAAQGNRLILFGLVFWTTMGLPFYVAQMVRQSTLSVRQDVLQLELALLERDEARA